MQRVDCLNLCEVMLMLSSYDEVSTMVKNAIKNGPIKSVSRVYVGSNFCTQYFSKIGISFYENILNYCKDNGILVTLVVPVVNQKNFNDVKNRIIELMKFDSIIDEITINDYGFLNVISKMYPNIKINFGRMLNKDTRDYRYDEYTNMSHTPELLTFDNNFGLGDIAKNVTGIEIDPTNINIDLNNTKYNVGIHMPYVYQTTGHVCEFASIGKEEEMKFRPNCDCKFQCMKVRIIHKLKVGDYFKFGRTEYRLVKELRVSNINSYRFIYFPHELRGDYHE